jgi:hypothetical protein
VSAAYVSALPRQSSGERRVVAVACAATTDALWRAAVEDIAPQFAIALVSERESAVSQERETLPATVRAVLRADGWRRPNPLAHSRRDALSAEAGSPAPSPSLRIHLGEPSSSLDAMPLGDIHATANGRVLGGSLDLVAELARGVPTATIEVWWTRPGESPRRIGRSVAMMRIPVARVNDGAFARRVAELLLEAARSVLDDRAQTLPEPPQDVLTQRARDDAARAAPPLRAADAVSLVRHRVGSSLAARSRDRQWCLGYRRTASESALESFARLDESELLVPPPGSMWADPFPVRAEGIDLLFFEEQRARDQAARLVCAELHTDGTLGPIVPVLEAATHLSYPNVFTWDGEWFMVPESASAGVVSLYRAVSFPHAWRHECHLLSGVSLVDATLLHREGRWDLLATRITADDVALEEVCGYSAPSLTGPWLPHAANPLVSDAYRGRPAGRFLEERGVLLRPAQDSSVIYGHGVSLQEITTWTPTRYAERTLVHRTADWAPHLDGVHTFNRSETLSCIDVARRTRRGRR